MTNWLTEKLASFKDDFVYEQEKYLLDVTRQACLLMESKKVSRSDLAKKLGVSKPYITELLSGKPNMTVQTMIKLAIALDVKLETHFVEPQAIAEATWMEIHEPRKVRGTLQVDYRPTVRAEAGGWRTFNPTPIRREPNHGESIESSSLAA